MTGKGGKPVMRKRIMVIGAVCWILGLVMTIVGMNVEGTTGQWISVIGNILFLLGLLLEGVCWFRSRRGEEGEKQKTPEKEQE